MSDTNNPFANDPVLGSPDATPPRGHGDLTTPMPATPPPNGTPASAGSPAGVGGQPPIDSGVPVTEPGPDEGPNNALLAVLAFVVLLAAGAGVFFLTRDDGSDTVATIGTDSTTTTVDTTVVDPTTTVADTTTTMIETSTTVAATTTVAETTTLPATTQPATTVAVAPIPVVTVPPAATATMWDVIVNSPDLSEFRAAIETAGLIDLLDGPDPITVFAPSNAAFEAFRSGVGNEALLADLPALLRHHIVAGALSSDEIFTVGTLDTLAGNTITVDDATKTVDGASLLVVDVATAGSLLNVTDRVLVPPA